MLIEVYSDVVCPWCYIGTRRLARAVALRKHVKLERRWRPFQLRPQMPREGVPWTTFVNQKFGSSERAQEVFAHVMGIAAAEGIALQFDRIPAMPNTTDAHSLILMAREHGLEWQMVHALYEAYFRGGRDLTKRSVLLSIASHVGIEVNAVENNLQTQKYLPEVLGSQQTAEEYGISSVPCYMIDARHLLSGVQSVEAFLRAFDAAEAVERLPQ